MFAQGNSGIYTESDTDADALEPSCATTSSKRPLHVT